MKNIFLLITIFVLVGAVVFGTEKSLAATTCDPIGSSGYCTGGSEVKSISASTNAECASKCASYLTSLSKGGCWGNIDTPFGIVFRCLPDGHIEAGAPEAGACTYTASTAPTNSASLCGINAKTFSSYDAAASAWVNQKYAFCPDSTAYITIGGYALGLPSFPTNIGGSVSWECNIDGNGWVDDIKENCSANIPAPPDEDPSEVFIKPSFNPTTGLCGVNRKSYTQTDTAWAGGSSGFCANSYLWDSGIGMTGVPTPQFWAGTASGSITWYCCKGNYTCPTYPTLSLGQECTATRAAASSSVSVPSATVTIENFSVSPHDISLGQNTYLVWRVSGADYCVGYSESIKENSLGGYNLDDSWSQFDAPHSDGETFQKLVSPTESMKYILACYLEDGTGGVADNVTVTVSGNNATNNKPTAAVNVERTSGGLYTLTGTGSADSGKTIAALEWSIGSAHTPLWTTTISSQSQKNQITDIRTKSFDSTTVINFRVKDSDNVWSDYASATITLDDSDTPEQPLNTCGVAARTFDCEEEWPDDCESICGCPSYYKLLCANDEVVPVWVNPADYKGLIMEIEQGDTIQWKCGTKTCTATRDDCGESTSLCGPAGSSDQDNPKAYEADDTAFSGDLCISGDPDPSLVTFPDPGGSVTWDCINGSNSETCYAIRKNTSTPTNLCGPAGSSDQTNPRVYSAYATQYPDNESFCVFGDPTPNPVPFPVQGGSVQWTCEGLPSYVTRGDLLSLEDQTCYARRNTVITTDDAECGPAGSDDSGDPRVYAYDDTGYDGNLCSFGDPTPNPVPFPARGESSSWTCYNSDGGNSVDCYAERNDTDTIIIDDDDEDDNDDEDEEETTVTRVIRRIREVIVPALPKAGFWFGK